ncbi:2,3-bisphosphoglycerate-dependent phosphoglycerate mutase 2-like [Hibiscus syriacus]|uniref:2,3-bisphosphoglycerate-dependent phosphoglycerate mutase 2-like n=1 Tax=Hibiscus syriacus TaxID=106335 RepID=UPI0019225BB7|nr:2,3-bisphosphoglycerate-dependent phosphoglycerate mutase 2-like [Hibiscus syriacus]
MADVMLHPTVGTLQLLSSSGIHSEVGNNSVSLLPKDLKVEVGFSKRGVNSFGVKKFSVIQASASQTSVFDPVLSPSNESTHESLRKTNEAALILILHGESLWNEKNLFTGCVDVPLTKKGVEEAIEAGKRISNIPVDMIFTSALIHAHMTAMLAMTQHRHNKVPITMHNENEQARLWSQIHSEDTVKQSIPVICIYRLRT